MWSFQTQFFLTYADAVGRGDTGAAADARRELRDFQSDFATFVDTVTAGAVPAADVSTMIGEHIDQMLGQLDAFHDGDLGAMSAEESAGHEYLATIAQTLAAALATQQPEAFPGSTGDGWAQFCSIAAGHLTSFVDGVTTAATTGRTIAPWTASLAAIADQSGDPTGTTLDPFSADDAQPLADLILRGVGTPTPELSSDANDVATLGSRLVATDADPTATPAAVRSAYASAYRLAVAEGIGVDRPH